MSSSPLVGVNLGNWLVLEKWMSLDIFAGTSAEDETELCRQLDALGPQVKAERFAMHRSGWIRDRDFAYLAARGVQLLRLPVPWFVFGGQDPYVGCADHVDRAFAWAEKHGMRVLLDLHTVPDSQNGFDNGGMAGVCKWHTKQSNIDTALDVLAELARRYGHRPALWGLEVLNEPVSPQLWELLDVQRRYPPADPEYAKGSAGVPTDVLREYYGAAYDRIRGIAPELRVVFHDGFRMAEWFDVLTAPDFTNIAVDTHQYHMVFTATHGHLQLEDYVRHVQEDMAAAVREASAHFPVIVGEWCVDTTSKYAPTEPGQPRVDYYRTQAQVQIEAWQPALAWCYWSYKHGEDTPASDIWDLLKCIELGFMPGELVAAAG
jgi:glucan 1,3-beta-glucosidase